jgi:hypothetical protein
VFTAWTTAQLLGKEERLQLSSSVMVGFSWQKYLNLVAALFMLMRGFSKNLSYVLKPALL